MRNPQEKMKLFSFIAQSQCVLYNTVWQAAYVIKNYKLWHLMLQLSSRQIHGMLMRSRRQPCFWPAHTHSLPRLRPQIAIYQLVRSSSDSHSENFYFYFTYNSKKVGIALDQPKSKSQALPFISSQVLGGKGFNFSKPPFSHLQNGYISQDRYEDVITFT